MFCLACGDCCIRMSPFTDEIDKLPCPYLEMHGNIAHCTNYEHRPEACINHSFPGNKCPIGMDVLKLTSETVHDRVARVEEDRGINLEDFYE